MPHHLVKEHVGQLGVQCRAELERHGEVQRAGARVRGQAGREFPLGEQVVEHAALSADGFDQVRPRQRHARDVRLADGAEPDGHARLEEAGSSREHHTLSAVRHERGVVLHTGDDVVHLVHRVAV